MSTADVFEQSAKEMLERWASFCEANPEVSKWAIGHREGRHDLLSGLKALEAFPGSYGARIKQSIVQVHGSMKGTVVEDRQRFYIYR